MEIIKGLFLLLYFLIFGWLKTCKLRVKFNAAHAIMCLFQCVSFLSESVI